LFLVFLLTPDLSVLYGAAKEFIHRLAGRPSEIGTIAQAPAAQKPMSSQMMKFQNLVTKMALYQDADRMATATSQSDTRGEIGRYLEEIQNLCIDDSFNFWRERRIIYPSLAIVAEDLLAAPAS
jgi:hypothetical protein